MPFQRPIWIVAGSPRVRVDAVRHITVPATGATAVALAEQLRGLGATDMRCLHSLDAVACLPEQLRTLKSGSPFRAVAPYTTYDDLTKAVEQAARAGPAAPAPVIVMTAAVNDYEVAAITDDNRHLAFDPHAMDQQGTKLPGGLREVRLHLRPTAKIIERIRREWNPGVYLVGFKNEAEATVVASAQKLQKRAQCQLVVANSIGLAFNAIVGAKGGVDSYSSRAAMLEALAKRIVAQEGA